MEEMCGSKFGNRCCFFFWGGESCDSFIHVLHCIHLHGTNFVQDSSVEQKEEMATRVQLLATVNITG